MYCETQQRFAGKSWMELFPDDSFPNDTPEDRARSKNMYTVHVYMYVHEIFRPTQGNPAQQSATHPGQAALGGID